jgi:predicted component of type VI protein secretion system
VAAALLDWRNQDYDAPEVLEEVFLDVQAHGVALAGAVIRGVGALLDELSPETIARERRSRPGVDWAGVFNSHRALWNAFRARYTELLADTRMFDIVFGPEFASSYREHLVRSKKPGPGPTRDLPQRKREPRV